MRKTIIFGLALLMLSQVLPAQQDYESFSMFLGRLGYFQASDSAFKDIYGNGIVFGGELRLGLGSKKIVGWLEGSHRARTGEFSFTGEETKAKVTAIELGALYRILPRKISPYAGAGLGYYMFTEDNVPMGKASQSKIGFCGAAGVSVLMTQRFVLDLRLKYSTCRMKPADYSINVGGLSLSLGAGVRF
jgi:opacity protein-like surface antigen